MDTHTPWKLEGANERIEKYRKGTAKIEFYKEGKKINTNGNEIKNFLYFFLVKNKISAFKRISSLHQASRLCH